MNTAKMSTKLSRAQLEAFDPHPTHQGDRSRYCCPLPGCEGKPVNKTHQSVWVEDNTGVWKCWRCKETGKLTENWIDRPFVPRKTRNRTALREAFALPPPRQLSKVAERPLTDHFRQDLAATLQPLRDTPGAAYLQGRGIPLDVARVAKVRYAPAWKQWEKDPETEKWRVIATSRRVVFPVYPRDGSELVAVQARVIAASEPGEPAVTRGVKELGVFATAGAWDVDPIIITEAPIDALSLAALGYPAIATLGCSLPEWMPKACAFRRVLIATDADEPNSKGHRPGDDAAAEWAVRLRSLGALAERLRPEGFKDWNEWLQRDRAGLEAFLHARIRVGEDDLRADALNPSELPGSGISVDFDAADHPDDTSSWDAGDVLIRETQMMAAPFLARIPDGLPEDEVNAILRELQDSGNAPLEDHAGLLAVEEEMETAYSAKDLERLRRACARYLVVARWKPSAD